MRVEEAVAIGRILSNYRDEDLTPLLNIGASTRDFREEEQPHIAREIFEPLGVRGIRCIHTDLKPLEGVDLSGDFLDPSFRAKLKELAPKCILCTNVLEHVEDIARFVSAVEEICPAGAVLIVTVPRSYPYHSDPIDNGFRPCPEELARRFSRSDLVLGETIQSTSYLSDLQKLSLAQRFIFVLKTPIRVLVPFYKPKKWLERVHRLFWLWRPYSVSLVVLKRSHDGEREACVTDAVVASIE